MALSQGRGRDGRMRGLPQCGHSADPICRQYSRSSLSRLTSVKFKPRCTVGGLQLHYHTAPTNNMILILPTPSPCYKCHVPDELDSSAEVIGRCGHGLLAAKRSSPRTLIVEEPADLAECPADSGASLPHPLAGPLHAGNGVGDDRVPAGRSARRGDSHVPAGGS